MSFLTRFFIFSGRRGRVSFLLANLFLAGFWVLAILASLAMLEAKRQGLEAGDLYGLWIASLVMVFPAAYCSFAIGSQRLHDIGVSGWWQLVALIPYGGLALMAVQIFWPGDKHANRFDAGWVEAEHGSAPLRLEPAGPHGF